MSAKCGVCKMECVQDGSEVICDSCCGRIFHQKCTDQEGEDAGSGGWNCETCRAQSSQNASAPEPEDPVESSKISVLREMFKQTQHSLRIELEKMRTNLDELRSQTAQENKLWNRENKKLSEKCGVLTREIAELKKKEYRFVQMFHFEKTMKLSLVLNSELWRPALVPAEFQLLLDQISERGQFCLTRNQCEELVLDKTRKPSAFLLVEGEQFVVVWSVVVLVNTVAEYCVLAKDMSDNTSNLLSHLAELLATFDCRTAKLVLAEEAVCEKTGLTAINHQNIVLASRALQLLLWLVPHIKQHFLSLLPAARLKHLDTVTNEISSHVKDMRSKLVSYVESRMVYDLKQWEAKPPVPSTSFQNICKRLLRLHKAIVDILPDGEIRSLFSMINFSFKTALREEIKQQKILFEVEQCQSVMQELHYYLGEMRKINALPEDELCIKSMSDVLRPQYDCEI